MPRIAGDSQYYSFNLTGGGGATDFGFDLPSVTSIIKCVRNGSFGAAAGWGYNLALEGVSEIAALDEGVRNIKTLKEELKVCGWTPTQQRDKATERGQNAHDVLEWLAKGEVYIQTSIDKPKLYQNDTDVALDISPYGDGVVKFWMEAGFDITKVQSEQPVWSLKHGFAGTLDLFLGESNILFDLKTHKPASKKQPSYLDDRLQVAAYALALEEMNPGLEIQNGVVFLATERGDYILDEFTLTELKDIFLLHLQIARYEGLVPRTRRV